MPGFRRDVAPNFYPAAIGVWRSDALLGGDGGGPRSGAVSGAERSGPPCCGVAGRGQPAEPRVGSVGVVVVPPARARRGCGSERNRVSFRNSSRSRPLKISTKAFWIGLPGAM